MNISQKSADRYGSPCVLILVRSAQEVSCLEEPSLIRQKCSVVRNLQLQFRMQFVDVFAAICVASPHILYAFIWFNPLVWHKKFGKHAVHVFAQAATAGKGM